MKVSFKEIICFDLTDDQGKPIGRFECKSTWNGMMELHAVDDKRKVLIVDDPRNGVGGLLDKVFNPDKVYQDISVLKASDHFQAKKP